MSATFFSIAPIFLLIMLGHIIRRIGILDFSFWNHANKLVYWVLMPCLLFNKVSSSDISLQALQHYIFVILAGFFSAVLLAIIVGKLLGFAPPLASSLLQGSARHNSFIALAIAAKLLGDNGLTVVTLGIAILIPATNIVVVSVMASTIPQKGQPRSLIATIIRSLLTNPIFLSIILGLCFFSLGFRQVPILHDTTKLLGDGAMPLVLLAIGASIRIKQFTTAPLPILSSSIIKLLIFPLISFGVAQLLGLSTLETTALLLVAAVPTAVSSYALAAQMGGDQKVMAAIITSQTLVSFISIPILLTVLENF